MAQNVVWAPDFRFDSTIDATAVKIASLLDEHSRESLLHLAGSRVRRHPPMPARPMRHRLNTNR